LFLAGFALLLVENIRRSAKRLVEKQAAYPKSAR